MIISEFRFVHPTASSRSSIDGALDEYVELYNNTDSEILVSSADVSRGWALAYTNGSGTTQTVAVEIPNGTTIPARGHLLLTNELGIGTRPTGITPTQGYSLSSYAAGDITYRDIAGGGTVDIPDDGAIALFQTTDDTNFTALTRLDAVSLNNSNGTFSALYREGTNLPSHGANDGQYAYLRKLTSGVPQDTDNNASDFAFVATDGGPYGAAQSQLGAPGPENLVSPIQRNATIKAQLIEPQAPVLLPPTVFVIRARWSMGYSEHSTSVATSSTTQGAQLHACVSVLLISPTFNSPGYVSGGSQADIRALDGNNLNITTSRGDLTVLGTTVEQPSPLNQPNGGALNSSLTVTIPGGQLMAGAAIDVHFLVGVQQLGSYRFFINVEALP